MITEERSKEKVRKNIDYLTIDKYVRKCQHKQVRKRISSKTCQSKVATAKALKGGISRRPSLFQEGRTQRDVSEYQSVGFYIAFPCSLPVELSYLHSVTWPINTYTYIHTHIRKEEEEGRKRIPFSSRWSSDTMLPRDLVTRV